jgi:cysteine desulfurase
MAAEEAKRLYLDAAATTPLHPDVLRRMQGQLDGGPASEASLCARAAGLLGVSPERLAIFPSGSAANNAAVGLAASLGARCISQPTEHPSVLRPLRELEERGGRVEWLPVSAAGRVDPGDLRRALEEGEGPALVSVMRANHETGVIQPTAELSDVCRSGGAYLHVDAVQAWRTLEVEVAQADLLTLSAHKLNGPKGVGVLIRSARVPRLPGSISVGSSLAAGLVASLELRQQRASGWLDATRASRDALQAAISAIPGALINGDEPRLASHLSVSFAGLSGEALVLELDLAGISCSSGAACSSAEGGPSPVLLALGRSRAEATGSLRFSLSGPMRDSDVGRVVAALELAVERLRSLAP